MDAVPSKIVVAGILIGVLGGIAGTRVLASVLFGVTPTNIQTYAGIAILMIAVAGMATWMPIRQALRVDPVQALRSE